MPHNDTDRRAAPRGDAERMRFWLEKCCELADLPQNYREQIQTTLAATEPLPSAEGEYANALAAMPQLFGTPDTDAFKRSNEKLAIWYCEYFGILVRALKQAVPSEPAPQPDAGAEGWHLIDTIPNDVALIVRDNKCRLAFGRMEKCLDGKYRLRGRGAYRKNTHWRHVPYDPEDEVSAQRSAQDCAELEQALIDLGAPVEKMVDYLCSCPAHAARDAAIDMLEEVRRIKSNALGRVAAKWRAG